MPLDRNELSLTIAVRLKDELKKLTWLFQPIGFAMAYGSWILIIRLLTLSFITYFVISPSLHTSHFPGFQDISDAFSSNEINIMGIAALLFVGLICSLNPLTSTQVRDVITREQVEKNFLPGFMQGTIIGGGIIVAFLLSGIYRYLGYFIQLEEAPLDIANVILRMAALGAMAYCEEFIFHQKITQSLREHLPDWGVAHLVAILYCGIKFLQFDLGIMHLISLYLVSLCLFYRLRNDRQFSRGAGAWAAILIVFQPLLSLPIFGNDFPGVLFIKYQSAAGKTGSLGHPSSISRFLTGGIGGPLSSLAFQLLLILDLARSILKQKKTI